MNDRVRIKIANINAIERSPNAEYMYKNGLKNNKIEIVDIDNKIDILSENEMDKYDILICMGVKGMKRDVFHKLRDGYHKKLIGMMPSFGDRKNIRLTFGSFNEKYINCSINITDERFKNILVNLGIGDYIPEWKIKKDGKILVAPNRLRGWYRNRFTITKFMDNFERLRKFTDLKFDLSLHRKDWRLIDKDLHFKNEIKRFCKDNDIKILKENKEKNFDEYYAIIADTTTLQFDAILNNCIPFNIEEDYKSALTSELVVTDLSQLDPNKLKLENLGNRDKWLRKMIGTHIDENEIINGKIYDIILDNYLIGAK